MQTAYHNLPTFNGVQQEPGEEFRACDVSYSSDEKTVSFSLDLQQAYSADSSLSAWRRSVTLIRRTAVTVQDTYSFESPPTDLQWHLITPSNVSQPGKGCIHLTSSSTVGDLVSAEGWINFDPEVVEVSQETIEIEDERMSGFWGARLYRINLTARSPKAEGSFDLRVTKHK